MLGKKIIAVTIAALTLIKVAFLLISPEKWLGMSQAFLSHTGLVMVVYLVFLAITGYFIFTSIDIIDILVVMGFTALLVGLSLIPYAASLQTTTQEIAATGIGKAWLALLIWVAIAVAVLYRVFVKER
jgi:uncharacterized membrane protein